MDTHENPESAAQHGKDHLQSAADDFKTAAAAKAEEVRRAAEQKAEELRTHVQGKAEEYRAKAEDAWSDAQTQARHWQHEGEAYVRENPARAVLTALGVGFLVGLLFRK